MRKIKFIFKKIKENPYLLLASLSTILIISGALYFTSFGSVKINKVSASTDISVCTGSYYTNAVKIWPSGINWKPFNWTAGVQYDKFNSTPTVITCNSYKNDRDRESFRVDNNYWYQYDCNGSWLGGVKWVKKDFIAPAYAYGYSSSCNNLTQSQCKTTSGCSWGTDTIPSYGSCVSTSYTNGQFKEVSNIDGGELNVRIQQFAIGSVYPGDVFTMSVYSHSVSVTANSSDTPSSIAIKMAYAVNNTTQSQWNSSGVFPYNAPAYTNAYFPNKPMAYSNLSSNEVVVRLDYQHQFAANVVRKCSSLKTPTQCSLYNGCTWDIPSPTIDLNVNGQKNITVTQGSDVKLSWSSNNAVSCSCSYIDNGVTKSCGNELNISSSQPKTISNVTSKTTFTVSCAGDTVNLGTGGTSAPTTTKACYKGIWRWPDPVHPNGGRVTYTNSSGNSVTEDGLWSNATDPISIYYKTGTYVSKSGASEVKCAQLLNP